MNRLTIIGNLTNDPVLRTTQSGTSVCSFDVAVNRRKTQNNQQPQADFFHVSAWREMGETCEKYLSKGRKVAVVGSVSVNTFQGRDGKTYANLEVMASEVEFLTPRTDSGASPAADQNTVDPESGYQRVDDEKLPF